MRTTRRPVSLALAATGLAAVGVGATGIASAHAAAAPGSNFGSLSISASAGSVRSPLYSHAGEDVEAEVPWSSSSLQSGGVGRAITSVFWPGDTGGHGGDTLWLLGAPCIPPNPQGLIPLPIPCVTHAPQPPYSVYQQLNDPYKAEAQTGAGNPTVTQTGTGVDMVATATPANVAASTVISGSKVPAVGDSFGATSSSTSIRLTGPNTAVVDATSTVHDVSLAGGAVTISAVTSVAHAVTTGKTATGTTSTTVAGMSVAGHAVTVDDKGIHLSGTGTGLPPVDATLNQLLKQSGVQLYLAKPTHSIQGAGVNLDSGSLVVALDNPQYLANGNDTGHVLVLGGVSVQAASSLGYPYLPTPSTVPPAAGGGGPTGAGNVSTPVSGGGAPLTQLGGTPENGQPPVVALARQTALPHGGVPVIWVVLVALGSAAVAFALSRLPDRVLAAGGAACTQGGTA